MIGPEPTIMLCADKMRTNDLLKKTSLAAIRTFTLREFMEQAFYPCFARPIHGSASVGAAMIKDEQELHRHAATFGEHLLIQEYVAGREFTIDVYRDRGGVVRSVVPRQRLTVRSGEVETGLTVKSEELTAATLELASRLDGLWGVFCCQCMWPDGGPPKFFEVNSRFGGGAPLSIAAGANLPLYLLEEITGREISGKIGEFTDNLLMMRYDSDIYIQTDDPRSLPGYDMPLFR